ncbi:unnamed protein product, partial [Musa textilis]
PREGRGGHTKRRRRLSSLLENPRTKTAAPQQIECSRILIEHSHQDLTFFLDPLSLSSQFEGSKALPSRLRYAFMGVGVGWGPATTRVRAAKERPQLPAQALPRRPRVGRAARPQ